MSQSQSRKRPAPGSSPLASNMQQSTYPMYPAVPDPSQLSNDQFLSWGSGSNSFPSNMNQNYMPAQNPSFADQSNQLVRRNLNQQLTTRSGRQLGQQPMQDPWADHEITTSTAIDLPEEEDDAELEAKAQAAKREALSKRLPKQIPPFIQKLSSFLEKDYTDLIRWSDDGNSFIVVDEDRFAQKLIPELFKHNNYASFVRQLNMYGFHKVVGLSDNSMRQSEKKSKTPREYRHPYFKRGRPDLLWLIEKPRSGNTRTTKGKQNNENAGNADKETEEVAAEAPSTDVQTDERNTELTTVPKADLASFKSLRKEVENLQKSQQQIFQILGRMRDDNNQYIKQATAMVANHERHESSINAILTFLATFYNQSLQNREGAGNMFAHAMPHSQPYGSVVDVGDYDNSTFHQPTQFPQVRRPRALLPPPTSSDSPVTDTSSSTTRPRTRSTSQKTAGYEQSAGFTSASPTSTINSPQPPKQSTSTRTSPRLAKDNSEILNVINRSNANTPQSTSQGPKFDFNSALQHYQNANGKSPLTAEQRDAMLSIMADNSGTTTPALTNHNTEPNPYLDYFNSNQEQLDFLQRLQEQQDSKVQDLADRLQPLSPSGSIPGLDLSQINSNSNINSDNFDINNFLDNDYLGSPNADLDQDFDFSQFAGANNDAGQVKTEDPTPPAANEANESPNSASLFGDEDAEVPEDDGDDDDDDDNDQVGRIVGSVASSSEHPTPSAEDTTENKAAEKASQSPRKKRRTGR